MITINYIRLVYRNSILVNQSRHDLITTDKLLAIEVLSDWNRIAKLQNSIPTANDMVYLYMLTELKPKPYYYINGDRHIKTIYPNTYMLERSPVNAELAALAAKTAVCKAAVNLIQPALAIPFDSGCVFA